MEWCDPCKDDGEKLHPRSFTTDEVPTPPSCMFTTASTGQHATAGLHVNDVLLLVMEAATCALMICSSVLAIERSLCWPTALCRRVTPYCGCPAQVNIGLLRQLREQEWKGCNVSAGVNWAARGFTTAAQLAAGEQCGSTVSYQ